MKLGVYFLINKLILQNYGRDGFFEGLILFEARRPKCK